ncbi:MAG: 2-C-methyl-D-erythritol 4-phosphate cytidylyltransferase [Bacteroidales bacterium]|nr:2-C-methyl-D-erythritol 4-phosphate cytidylyltransferase [Bacteroidales bacterium]
MRQGADGTGPGAGVPLYAVIVAGGSGTRMGADIPKQFLLLDGRPILLRTVERFVEAVPDIHLVVVLPEAHIARWRSICRQYELNVPQRIVPGGITRFHSVKNALEKVPPEALVAIHDGVRPLVSTAMIRAMFGQMGQARALVPALRVTDTLCSTVPGEEAPDRSRLLAVQTPQLFRAADIRAAYRQPFDVSFTDDGSVIRRSGITPDVFPGERTNIKITTKEDLDIACALLKLQQGAR